jgi:1-deoxy-D-xylulose-5-phosphate synthase
LECLNGNGLSQCRITRIGIEDVFVEHGPQSKLRSMHKLDAKAIAQAASELVASGQ